MLYSIWPRKLDSCFGTTSSRWTSVERSLAEKSSSRACRSPSQKVRPTAAASQKSRRWALLR